MTPDAATIPPSARPREAWPRLAQRHEVRETGDAYDLTQAELRDYAAGKPWVWPNRPTYFLCDLHADTDALWRSLETARLIERHGAEDRDFDLTDAGRGALLLFGGDFLDKGPHNLRLLRAVRLLLDRGADARLLAGNHDVRALVGLSYAGCKEPLLAHLFVRMGKKSAPLFREVYDEFLAGTDRAESRLSDAAIRELLFPPKSWYRDFPEAAVEWMPPEKIDRELRRIREKTEQLEHEASQLGLSLQRLHAAFLETRRQLTHPEGEFAWFFDGLQIGHRVGSLLFVHAGVDDTVAEVLRDAGIDGLNHRFRDLMQRDLFALYHGAIGNAFRTKYRDTDAPLTERGVRALHEAGIYAIVHGHRNILRGQRMVLRAGILNFECDVSLDANTRAIEGLAGAGAGITAFLPSGIAEGHSVDHDAVKQLVLAHHCDLVTLADASPHTPKEHPTP